MTVDGKQGFILRISPSEVDRVAEALEHFPIR